MGQQWMLGRRRRSRPRRITHICRQIELIEANESWRWVSVLSIRILTVSHFWLSGWMSRCLPPCKIRYIGYSRDYRSLACAVSSRSIWTTSRCLQFTSAYNDGGTPNSPPLPLSKRDGWVPTIGLELHVQLKSPIKLFSSSKTSHDEIPNSNVSSYDAALPGTLPVDPSDLAIRLRMV